MAYGVFGLNKAYVLNRKQVFSTDATHGWSGAGFSTISSVERIDFSNDLTTASLRGSLSTGRFDLAATSNSNYGWFGGGTIGFTAPVPVVTTVDRIDFSNDSTTASVRGSLVSARTASSAVSNFNYGWFAGGDNSSSAPILSVTAINRIDFSNDSAVATVRGSLFFAVANYGSVGNSDYGWFGGGLVASILPYYSLVSRIDYTNDSAVTSVRGPLTSPKGNHRAITNSNYGWFTGGRIPANISTVERINFSNDLSATSIRGPLSSTKQSHYTFGNSDYGWVSGIIAGVRLDRIDYSNDLSTASIRGEYAVLRGTGAVGTSGQAKSSSIRPQKTGSYGWFGGGFGPVSTVDRIDFSNDSARASVRGPLSAVRYNLAATGNSNYGWFGGGRNPVVASTVDRIDFSNDSSTASARGPLSLARRGLVSTGNSNYGWFGGGFGPVSTVDRIDFSNDSSTASPRGPLSSARYYLAATGNSNYGWFGGGISAGPTISSTVDRIDFSNDSSTASARGPLSSARRNLAATGNSNYGWFGGGGIPGAVSTVDRIDFSNDSSTASARGPLSSARSRLIATGNSNYGWFGGGYVPITNISTVDRIDFSNDSATASVRGPLSSTRSDLAATSNTSIG